MSIPNDETGEALKLIASNGSDLNKPMEIDFFVAIPSKEKGDLIALKVRELGFDASVEQDDETLEWTCYCTKTLIPRYSEIIEIEQQLNSMSKPYGGYSDGFGSYGNA
jgi:Regulator of ribonuclease activity B